MREKSALYVLVSGCVSENEMIVEVRRAGSDWKKNNNTDSVEVVSVGSVIKLCQVDRYYANTKCMETPSSVTPTAVPENHSK